MVCLFYFYKYVIVKYCCIYKGFVIELRHYSEVNHPSEQNGAECSVLTDNSEL